MRRILNPLHYRLIAAIFLISTGVFQHLSAQDIAVSGTVTGSDGAGIPGVTVVIDGTTVGVASDLDGKYNINAQWTKHN